MATGVNRCYHVSEAPNSNLQIPREAPNSKHQLVIRDSSFLRHSTFVLRHFPLQHPDRARNEENHDAEGDENLDHREDFCPACQKRCVSGTESGALRERNKEIIDKKRPPSFAFESPALAFLDLHLREEKTSTAKLMPLAAHGRPAAVKPPIPKREDEDIR